MRLRPRGTSAKYHQHDDRQRDDDQRHELRGREHEDGSPRIAAIELDDEARDAVEDHVGPERAAGERAAAALGGEQQHQDQQLGAGFVQLRRVQRHTQRRADVLRGVLVVKCDRPGHVRLPAEAAAGKQTAHPADDVSERDAGGEHVRHRPHRHPMPAQIPQGDRHRGDEAPVKDPPGAEQIEELGGVRRVLVELDNEEEQLRADQRADDDPDPQIHHAVGIEAPRPCAHQRELQTQQVRRSEQDAVGVDREAPDFKQDWVHVVARCRSYRAGPGWPRS